MKLRILSVVGILVAIGAIGLYIAPVSPQEPLGDTVSTLDAWKVVSGNITPRNASNGLQVPSLVSCNTIDTDGNGVFSCGTDEGGSGGSWSTSTADYWATTDLKLQELSDVQDPSAWGQLLMWTGSVWSTTSTSSLGIVGASDGNWSTTSADHWETLQTARTADDLSDNTTSDLAEGTNLYWTSARATSAVSALIAATTTTAIDEGTNLYYTDLRVGDYITGSTTLCVFLTGSADLCDGVDASGTGGTGLATSTAIADTYVIYGTAPGTVGAESAFTYDDATDKLTVVNASTTNVDISTGLNIFGGGLKTTANALCIQLTGSAALCDSGDDTGTDSADDLSNNTTTDLAEGTNLYWTSARATTAINAILVASSSIPRVSGTTFGQMLQWTGSAWGLTSTSTLGIAWANITGIPAGFADGTDDTGTDTLDDLSNNSIEDLNDVAAMTENYGDLLGWNGTTWTDFATSSLAYSWTNLTNIPAGFSDGTDNTGIGTTTAIADTQIIYGTGVGTVGAEAAFNYSTSLDRLTVVNASTTNMTLSTGLDIYGGGLKTTANSLCIQLTGSADLCDGVDGGGALADDSVTPNKVKSTGQTDEYCLSYETTGATWEWQLCGNTGGNMSGWATTTSSVAGSLNLFSVNATDILNIGGSATTSSEFWMDPNTSTFQINGSTGSSTYVFGSAGNEWLLGTSDANKNFRIASSTGLLDGVSEFFTITKTGNVGFGSTTPFAKVSIVHTATTSPSFAVATSTTAAPIMSLWTAVTTLGGSLDSARMILGYPSPGIWQWAQNGVLRDPLNVSRINTGDWFALVCNADFAKKTAANTADITGSVQSTTLGGLCGDFSIIEDANGQVDYVVAAGSGYSRLRPGATGTVNAAGDGIGYALTTAFMRTATNTPIMETSARIQTNGNATSTLVIIGFTSATGVSADYAAAPTAGCYFTASTTQANIIAVCKDGATISMTDTGTASNTAQFIRYRVEMESGKGTFFMATSTGKWTNVANLVTGIPLTTSLNPQVTIAGVSAGTIGGELWVRFVRAWYRDPEWQ